MRIRLSGDHSTYHCGSAAAFSVIVKEVSRYGQLVGETEDYDLLVVNGEGSMHHSSGGFVKKMNQIEGALERNKRVMLINTVWQDNPQQAADVLLGCEKVIVREVLSQKQLEMQGLKVKVCIDQSYHATIDESAPFVDFKGGIVFTDFWSKEFESFVKLTSKWANKFHFMDMQGVSWSSMVKSLRTASLLVTGRHHAVYAACKAEIPFSALKGNTHKIEGLIETSGVNIPIHSNIDEVKGQMMNSFSQRSEYNALFDWMKRNPPWQMDTSEF